MRVKGNVRKIFREATTRVNSLKRGKKKKKDSVNVPRMTRFIREKARYRN